MPRNNALTMLRRRSTPRFSIALALGLAALAPARADDGPLMPRQVPDAYVQECGACHTAFAPALLPAASWQRIMAGLDRHFGTDASLDPTLTASLAGWLKSHAAAGQRTGASPPQDRITLSAWFQRKHHDVDPTAWRSSGVKSAANCGACHAGADRGNFDDDDLLAPARAAARLNREKDD